MSISASVGSSRPFPPGETALSVASTKPASTDTAARSSAPVCRVADGPGRKKGVVGRALVRRGGRCHGTRGGGWLPQLGPVGGATAMARAVADGARGGGVHARWR
eukprot:7391427-Prymnesium_polylepis.1